MLKISPTNSKQGNASPAEKQFKESFFNQSYVTPHPIDRAQVLIHPLPGSGIPMRDYFAAQAMATCMTSWSTGEPSSARAVAEWCYRIADEMLKARETNPGDSESQFHEDYLKK